MSGMVDVQKVMVDNTSLQREVNALRGQLSAAKDDHYQLLVDKQTLEQAVAILGSQVAALNEERQQSAVEAAALESSNAQLAQTVAYLKGQMAEARSKRDRLGREVSALRQQLQAVGAPQLGGSSGLRASGHGGSDAATRARSDGSGAAGRSPAASLLQLDELSLGALDAAGGGDPGLSQLQLAEASRELLGIAERLVCACGALDANGGSSWMAYGSEATPAGGSPISSLDLAGSSPVVRDASGGGIASLLDGMHRLGTKDAVVPAPLQHQAVLTGGSGTSLWATAPGGNTPAQGGSPLASSSNNALVINAAVGAAAAAGAATMLDAALRLRREACTAQERLQEIAAQLASGRASSVGGSSGDGGAIDGLMGVGGGNGNTDASLTDLALTLLRGVHGGGLPPAGGSIGSGPGSIGGGPAGSSPPSTDLDYAASNLGYERGSSPVGGRSPGGTSRSQGVDFVVVTERTNIKNAGGAIAKVLNRVNTCRVYIRRTREGHSSAIITSVAVKAIAVARRYILHEAPSADVSFHPVFAASSAAAGGSSGLQGLGMVGSGGGGSGGTGPDEDIHFMVYKNTKAQPVRVSARADPGRVGRVISLIYDRDGQAEMISAGGPAVSVAMQAIAWVQSRGRSVMLLPSFLEEGVAFTSGNAGGGGGGNSGLLQNQPGEQQAVGEHHAPQQRQQGSSGSTETCVFLRFVVLPCRVPSSGPPAGSCELAAGPGSSSHQRSMMAPADMQHNQHSHQHQLLSGGSSHLLAAATAGLQQHHHHQQQQSAAAAAAHLLAAAQHRY